MEIFTKNSSKCTIFQRNDCNNFSSLMHTGIHSKIVKIWAIMWETRQSFSGGSGKFCIFEKKIVCSNRSNKNSNFFPMFFEIFVEELRRTCPSPSKNLPKSFEELGQELRRFFRSFCQVLRSFLRVFFWILFLNLIVVSKSPKVPSKFFEAFSNIPSKLFQYSFEDLRTIFRRSSKLLSKTFEFMGKNNFQIVFKLLENSVFF
jgi:hypothetical protein